MLSRLSLRMLARPQLTFLPRRGVLHLEDRAKDPGYKRDELPQNLNTYDENILEETEVITRMKYVLNQFKLVDLKTLDWDKNFEDVGLDSLDQTAIITSFEKEFHCIFEDTVFDTFDNFNQVKKQIIQGVGS